MLEPSRMKYRKAFKGRVKGNARAHVQLNFGCHGIKAVTYARLTAKQIEAARRVVAKSLNRRGILKINVFPFRPVTKKPVDSRMGSGKGPLDHWVDIVKPGEILFEVHGVMNGDLARDALLKAVYKLPLKCVYVSDDCVH